MPTVDEVLAAGYPAEKMQEIQAKRDELVRRFDRDPEFKAEVLRDRSYRAPG